MNSMLVSPLFKVSSSGPVASLSGDLVHLRQGELDGACGPYCVISALIAFGLMDRDDVVQNMYSWKGSSRKGRFRDALYAFGVLNSEGTDGGDLVWLTDYYTRMGLKADHVKGSKSQVFERVADAIELNQLPIVEVHWQGGGAHWLMVVGYQGEVSEGETQLTHLLCLDPGQEAPIASLWNAVLEVYTSEGLSISRGPMSSNFWGMDGQETKCQVKSTVILSLPRQTQLMHQP